MSIYEIDESNPEEIEIQDLILAQKLYISTARVFQNNGIWRLGDFSKYTPAELAKLLDGFHVKEISSVFSLLGDYGIRLKAESEDIIDDDFKLIDDADDNIIIEEDNDECCYDTDDKHNDANSNYFFVALNDNLTAIRPEPNQSYFALLAAIFGEERFVTYEAVVNHVDMYIGEYLFGLLDTLTDREKSILIKRYGLDGGKLRTLEDVGRDYNLSRERIRQIEAKALRKMRHPSRSRTLKNVFLSEKQSENVQCPVEYSRYYEELIRKEIAIVNANRELNPDSILFDDIFASPRFKGAKFYSGKLIDDLGFSVRTFNCLKRAGIKTAYELMQLTPDDLMKVRNLGRKSAKEVLEKQTQIGNGGELTLSDQNCNRIKQYDLDADGIFTVENEIPITRTKLMAKDMLRLLQEGFFYVSDFLDYYDIIAPKDRHGIRLHILSDEKNALSVLKRYSTPMLRIRISEKLQTAMKSRGINTLKVLEEKQIDFPKLAQNEIHDLLLKITEVSNQYGIQYK